MVVLILLVGLKWESLVLCGEFGIGRCFGYLLMCIFRVWMSFFGCSEGCGGGFLSCGGLCPFWCM